MLNLEHGVTVIGTILLSLDVVLLTLAPSEMSVGIVTRLMRYCTTTYMSWQQVGPVARRPTHLSRTFAEIGIGTVVAYRPCELDPYKQYGIPMTLTSSLFPPKSFLYFVLLRSLVVAYHIAFLAHISFFTSKDCPTDMEVFQPTPILPSRVPGWTDVDEASARVLREQSGNKQLAYHQSQPFAQGYAINDARHDGFLALGLQGHLKPSYQLSGPSCSLPSNEDIYSAQTVKPREYRNHRHTSYRSRRPGENEAEKSEREFRRLEQTARHLAALFTKCDGYIKYRNRQPKQGTKGDQKWPDHMEDAFLRGRFQKGTFLLSSTDVICSTSSLAPSWAAQNHTTAEC